MQSYGMSSQEGNVFNVPLIHRTSLNNLFFFPRIFSGLVPSRVCSASALPTTLNNYFQHLTHVCSYAAALSARADLGEKAKQGKFYAEG